MIKVESKISKTISQLFETEIAICELDWDMEYDSVAVADITKKIIETTLKVSMEYLEELNRID